MTLLKEVIEILKQMKDTFICFILAILSICPYLFFDLRGIDIYFSDKYFNYLAISMAFTFIAIYSLFKKEKIFRKGYSSLSKLITLFVIFIFYLVIFIFINKLNASYEFKEKINFNKNYSIEEQFKVYHKSTYRVLLLSYYNNPSHCIQSCENGFVNLHASLELYEDGKPILFLPTPQKHRFELSEPMANINEVVLSPNKNYKFISNITQSDTPSNSEFYIEIRTDRYSKLRESISLLGIHLYLFCYTFFFIFCLGIIAMDTLKKFIQNRN